MNLVIPAKAGIQLSDYLWSSLFSIRSSVSRMVRTCSSSTATFSIAAWSDATMRSSPAMRSAALPAQNSAPAVCNKKAATRAAGMRFSAGMRSLRLRDTDIVSCMRDDGGLEIPAAQNLQRRLQRILHLAAVDRVHHLA